MMRHLPFLPVLLAVTVASCRSSDGDRQKAAGSSNATAADVVPPAATVGGDSLVSRADQARIQGNPKAALWVVEISDFQCPFCRDWHDATYGAIQREYIQPGKIRFAYINLPLPMHEHSQQAAEAAMCAGAQGKFWPMHDALFSTQERWGTAADFATAFDSLASSVGAQLPAFRQCVQNRTMQALVEADRDRATQANVVSTPTFLIGSTMIEGAAPTARFEQVIDSALAAGAGARPAP